MAGQYPDPVPDSFGVKGIGERFRSPADAYARATELEHDAEDHAAQLRADGKEAAAVKHYDGQRAKAEKIRKAATAHRSRGDWQDGPGDRALADLEGEPGSDTPLPAAAAGGKGTGASKSGKGKGGGLGAGAGRRARAEARRGWRQSGVPQAAASWSGIGYRIAGATVGLAALLILVSDRGAGAFSGLLGGAARAVELVVGPGDPLAVGSSTPAAASTPAAGVTTKPRKRKSPDPARGARKPAGPKRPTATSRR